MSTPLFTLKVAPDVAGEDRDALLLALQTEVELQGSPNRNFDWELFVAIAKGIGTVASSAVAVTKAGKIMVQWRNDLHDKKRAARARLSRPGMPDLDLDKATDEEIRAWLPR